MADFSFDDYPVIPEDNKASDQSPVVQTQSKAGGSDDFNWEDHPVVENDQDALNGAAQNPTGISKAQTLLSSYLHNAGNLLPGGTQGIGGVSAALGGLAGGDTNVLQNYREGRDITKQQEADALKANPTTGIVGGFFGGALPTMMGVGLLPQAAMAAANTSSADLTNPTQQNLTKFAGDTIKGTGEAYALGKLFPTLFSSAGAANGAGDFLKRTLMSSAAGAGIGGIIGAAGSNGDITTPEGRQQILDASKNPAIAGGLIGGLAPAVSSTVSGLANTQLGQNFKDAYKYGKQGVKLFGTDANNQLGKELEDTSQNIANATKEEVLGKKGKEAVDAVQKVADSIQNFTDQGKARVGKAIGQVYDEAQTSGKTVNVDDIMDKLKGVIQDPELTPDESRTVRDLSRILENQKLNVQIPGQITPPTTKTVITKGILGEPIQQDIHIPEIQAQPTTETHVLPITSSRFNDIRKEVGNIAFNDPGADPKIRKLAADTYKGLSERGMDFLDDPQAQQNLQTLNNQYSTLKNLQDLTGEGNYVRANGGVDSSSKLLNMVSGYGENQLDPVKRQMTDSIFNSIDQVNPDTAQRLRGAAAVASRDLENVNSMKPYANPTTVKNQIPNLAAPFNNQSEGLKNTLSAISEANPQRGAILNQQAQDAAKKMKLTQGLNGILGEKIGFFNTAKKLIGQTPTIAGNTLGYIGRNASDPEFVNGLSQSAASKGYSKLAGALNTLVNKDTAGRNAALYTMYQDPSMREQLKDISSDQNNNGGNNNGQSNE